MSGEGFISNRPNTGAVIPSEPDTGAGEDSPARSGDLLRRIARKLLPHPMAVPVTVALAAKGLTDEQLREIDRRIAQALIAERCAQRDAQRHGIS